MKFLGKKVSNVMLIYAVLLATGILFLSFRFKTNPVYITGHLRRSSKESSIIIQHVSVFVKLDKSLVVKAVTDRKGNFDLTLPDPGTFPANLGFIKFYYANKLKDTILLGSVKTFPCDTPEMTFYLSSGDINKASLKMKCKQ